MNKFIKFSPYSDEHHEITLAFSQMQAGMQYVPFYFQRKTRIKIIDSGLVDIILSEEGLMICFVLLHLLMGVLMCIAQATVRLVSSNKNMMCIFKVKSIIVKVDALKFSIHDLLIYICSSKLGVGLKKYSA
jgi:hypothetical protein